MKKRKCKQYLKLVMLLFGVTLVLSSCQKDDDLIQIEQKKNSNQTDFKISKIDKSKLAENTTLTRKLTKLSSNLRNKKSNNSQNKTLVSNEFGFTIDTSYATYIESADKTYHSYTFYIQRDVEVEMLENLLVSLEPDGTYKTSIISYNITAAEKEDISNNIYVDITNKVSSTVINDEGIISDIFNKAADCSGYVLVEWCSGTAGHDGSNNYADCTAYNSDRIYFGCGFPGGGGSTGGSTGNTSPNTGETSGSQTNNGGSGGSSSNGGVTTPTIPQPWEKVVLCLSQLGIGGSPNGFTAEMSAWLQSQPKGVVGQISYYIDKNECSETAQAFAIEAVVTLMNGGEVDFPNKIIIDSTFVNNAKVKCTYQQISKNKRIKNLLESFIGEESDYDLKFQVVQDLQCNNALDPSGCSYNYLETDNLVNISIDQDYVNSNQTPTLFIARTIIHEAIHANLYLALFNLNNGNTINLPDINNFEAIYEEYRVYKGWQHEVMANHYIGLVTQTLQEIHPLLNDQTFIDSLNNDYPDMAIEQFYTCIAYLGLNGTVGQTNYLSIPENAINYSNSFEAAKVYSTKIPNCN